MFDSGADNRHENEKDLGADQGPGSENPSGAESQVETIHGFGAGMKAVCKGMIGADARIGNE